MAGRMTPAVSARPPGRLAGLLRPWHGRVPAWEESIIGSFVHEGAVFPIPRYRFLGPSAGHEAIRLGLFAGVHGDEPAGTLALADFAAALATEAARAAGYELMLYPMCNPVGLDAGTRANGRGKDLNREFWRNSSEPEVAILEAELTAQRFDGIITLHTDDTSEGLYGYAHGRVLNEALLKPALAAAAQIIPRDGRNRIDGFSACEGVLRPAGSPTSALRPDFRDARPRPAGPPGPRGCRRPKRHFGGISRIYCLRPGSVGFFAANYAETCTRRPASFSLPLLPMPRARRSVLPGFGLSLGFTLAYLGLIVLVPLSAAFARTAGMGGHAFLAAVTSPRVLAAYRLSFGASFAAALVNTFFGLIVAWVLVRYPFPGRRIVDALVDLPFALPTAVAGIALTALYAPHGWIGQWLAPLGLQVAFTRLGVFVALTFIGLPFVVRTIQPVLLELEPEIEECSASLGANRWQTLVRVIMPELVPSLLTGFALAFARAVGEYGSVVFISGNMPMRTEIVPLLIITKLEQYDYAGATAMAVVMLVASFLLLLIINLLQKWSRRFQHI
jgi:sulfate/thiosulfate transport system permease protein